MSQINTEIASRIRELREACEFTPEEMAEKLKISVKTYMAFESSGADVPISAIYEIANICKVDFTEIVTGLAARLNTYQVVRRGEGKEISRFPGYFFEDLAFRYSHKIMQPLLVTLFPDKDKQVELVTHPGQEFNLVLEGTVVVIFEDKEIVLQAGDSIYFNPNIPHGQKNGGEGKARFLTVIAE